LFPDRRHFVDALIRAARHFFRRRGRHGKRSFRA
jgi:hypothetical protein